MNTTKTGFTLLEFVAVIIILGILATITISFNSRSKEDSMNNEAVANLRLIQTAEKTRKIIDGDYVSVADIASLNSALRLSLPTAAGYHWDYKVTAVTDGFTAKAQRTADDNRLKCMDQDDDSPFTTGCSW